MLETKAIKMYQPRQMTAAAKVIGEALLAACENSVSTVPLDAGMRSFC